MGRPSLGALSVLGRRRARSRSTSPTSPRPLPGPGATAAPRPLPDLGMAERLAMAGVAGLALLAALGATVLFRQVSAEREALAALREIDDAAAQEQWIARRIGLHPTPDLLHALGAVRERLARAAAQVERAEPAGRHLDRLVGVGAGVRAVARVRAAVQEQARTVDELVAHVLAGEIEVARAVALRDLGPEVHEAVARAGGAYGQTVARAHRPVAAAAAISAALASAAMTWVGWRVVRFSRAARRLQREERALRVSAERFRALVQHAVDILLVVEADGTLRHVSPAIERILGHDPAALVGTQMWTMVHPADVAAARAFHAGLVEQPGEARSIELRWQHRDGSARWVEISGANLLGHSEVRGLVLNARDLTRDKSLQQELVQRALHDQLTGLPNRTLFMDRLEHAIDRCTRRGRFVGVLFLDLDRFKLVNDNFGHDRGDQLLVDVAQRLRTCLRRIDTIARVGGDEFTILLEDLTSAGDAILIAERVMEALREPIRLDGQEVFVTASIGIALGDAAQSATGQGLLRDADVAMYRAKANGRAGYEVFRASMRESGKGRLKTEADLRRALARDELRLHYQPQVELATGRIVGFEALVRWEHPERGLLAPAAFVPIAEESGLVLPLGRWVLETACRQASEWCADPEIRRGIVMAVNLSPRQFRHPHLVDDLAQVLTRTRLDPDALEIEITEGTAMGDADATVRTLERLKTLGVRLAIDDFGTGYSSLSYLRRFPIDVLKVDRSFVAGLPGNGGDAAIIRSVVSLARALGLKAVAEGVETPAQLEELRALGCDQGQGYLFGKPVPAEEAERLLRDSSHRVVPA
jgi:diguanylate cyclase (GGDEF)-like protein/PAS domain S-box-containing protein